MKVNNQNKGNLLALICVGTTILALFGLAFDANDDQHISRDLLAEEEAASWETLGCKKARILTRELGLFERDSWDLERFIWGLRVRFGEKTLDEYREIYGCRRPRDFQRAYQSAGKLMKKGLKERAHLIAYIRGFREGWLNPDQGSDDSNAAQINPQDAAHLAEFQEDLWAESDVEDSLESYRQHKFDKSKRLRKKRSTERKTNKTEFEKNADWWSEDEASEENFETSGWWNEDDEAWETLGCKTARGMTRALGLTRAERDSTWDLKRIIWGLQVRFGGKMLDEYCKIGGSRHRDYRTGYNMAGNLMLKKDLKEPAHLDAYIRGFRKCWLNPDEGSQIDPQDASYLTEKSG